jgi:peptidyl-prolyl cis-trans isomerase B (cyclophilin B)
MSLMAERHPKRQRKKEAAAARRQARMEAAVRARRRRRILYVVTALVGLGVVGGGAFMATRSSEEDSATTASPTPEAPSELADRPVACEAEEPEAAGEEKPTFEAPEDQGLDPSKTYIWRLRTSCGPIDVALDVQRAPKTTNSVAFLTRQGYYNGLLFHRLVQGFVIQGGDPEGTGTGGPGYSVEEAPPADLKYAEGIVAMAKAGNEPPGTSGSQFYIASGDATQLPAEYALVGTVTEGLDVAKQIESFAQEDQTPSQRVYIESAEIVEEG